MANHFKEEFNEEKCVGKIAAIFGESVFLSDGQIENDGRGDGDTYADLGDDSIEEIESELEKHVCEAVANGLLKKEGIKLEYIVQCNKSVIKLRLGSGEPPKASPMKVVP